MSETETLARSAADTQPVRLIASATVSEFWPFSVAAALRTDPLDSVLNVINITLVNIIRRGIPGKIRPPQRCQLISRQVKKSDAMQNHQVYRWFTQQVRCVTAPYHPPSTR